LAFDPYNKAKYTGEAIKFNENVELVVAPVKKKYLSIKIPSAIICNLIIANQVKKFRPDIVHAHQGIWLLGAYNVKKRIATFHSYKEIARNSVSIINDFIHVKIIPGIVDKLATIYTVVGLEVEEELKKDTRKKVYRIPNPVTIKEAGNQGDVTGLIKAITCSLLIRRKRLDAVIKIVKIIKDMGRDIEMSIIGPIIDRDYYMELVVMVEQFGLNDNIKFVGGCTHEEVMMKYASSNLAVFTSEEETFGVAPMEMIGAGLPIICTKVGVVKERISDFKKFKSILLIDLDDLKLEKIEIDELLRSNKNEAREFVKEEYSAIDVLKKYEAIYSNL
jgi:glycosyltransferase involved in cell wall biosynthesis